MSYCRFGDQSDVYLYPSVYGRWDCCNCFLGEPFRGEILTTLGEVLAHLQAHRDAGHQVPEHAFDRVRAEIEELGTDYVNPSLEEINEESIR